ncbi:Transcriptional regulator, TetR family [Granulibacter bethesdensis]|uniref:Transcriptional regulator, TetR family n=1 Tax=Granulibacter bethesdensis TaxID=364410 RepID=A0AAC9K9I4_9PROT|nr:TetR/AcrR family transcriptional regulator [Granulibacter bethesdensis]APH54117.1 Transcriptional regulator, TetR family [Granulibacter bethesdensis]APH61699.1 Transcriptional regulator, TetR family [Granulibacter bethesdensis]
MEQQDRAAVIAALGEVFREHGYEGASLSLITARTGLGKSSLYHLFPGGKQDMAEEVLADVTRWFEEEVFRPLREQADTKAALTAMIEACIAYFRGGGRVCLVGAWALSDTRDRFRTQIMTYFSAWRDALADALMRGGMAEHIARKRAEEMVALIQGALVAARALDDATLFPRMLRDLSASLVSR